MNRTRIPPRARGVLVAAAALAFAVAAQAQDGGKPDGKAVFTKWCAPCHGDGPGKPGTAALQALYKGAKPALLTKQFVRTGVSVMPFFRKTEISDAELEALAAYLAHK
jgi:mono/diheme cytochrome c family protein